MSTPQQEENRMKDNELIAEFMGALYRSGPDHFNPDRTIVQWIIKGNPFNQHRDDVKHWYSPEHLLYHQSWDWLMPVVQKITGMPYESEEVDNGFGAKVTVVHRPYLRTFGMINDENGHYMARFNRCALHMAPTLIEATYSAVVEFIKIHNQQPKQ